MDDDGSGDDNEVPWQGRAALEARFGKPPPSSSEILQRHRAASQAKALAIVAPIDRIVEATLDALDRYEGTWTVSPDTPFDEYYTSIPQRARSMFPDEAEMVRLCEQMREVETKLTYNASHSIVRELEGGSVHARCHALIETLRRARMALSCAAQNLGETIAEVETEAAAGGGGWYAETMAQLEPPTRPSLEAMQRARDGISGFMAATGRQSNGGVDKWERNGRAVRALEECIRETIAEFPQQFVLFEKQADRLSACRVWWDADASGPARIPWTRLLSAKHSGYEKNLGILTTKTNPHMLRMIRRLVVEKLY